MSDRPEYYPSHATEAGKVFAAIPTDALPDCPEGRAVIRSQQRLWVASRLISAAVTGSSVGLTSSGPWATLTTAAVRLADALITANDQFGRPAPPAQPAAVAVNGGPHSAACVRDQTAPAKTELEGYLRWLAERDGSCLTSEHPPHFTPQTAADCRRHLLKLGLLTATHAASAMHVTGYAMTARGWNAVDPLPRPAGDAA